jgi:general secretion pathway protein D
VVNLRRLLGTCVAAGLAGSLLAGCDLTTLSGYKAPQHQPDPFETVQNTNLDPRFPEQVAQPAIPHQAAPGESYYGHETAMEAAPAPAQAADSGEGYELNFENTAVTTVAKVVLGDILHVGYTIDPRVQGTVTISSGRSVPKRDLIPVLENALRMSNVVLVADGARGYRLIPSGDAAGSAPAMAAGSGQDGGYGISVVPLRYTSAQNILKLLDSFAIKAGMARADLGHNLILVEGDGPDRKAAVDTILSFDVDWMRGQSVGIYPLENAAPEEMIKELSKIMENEDGGLNHTLFTLQPVARLNAVLVVARRPNLLKQTATWIKRLDHANNAGESVHVYRLRYGDARQIAKVLGDLFGAHQQQGLESPVNQIAPGSGTTTATSGIFGGQQGGGGGGVAATAQTGTATATATGGTGAGIQLGNMGSGFGNSQGLVGAGGSAAVGAGAFGTESGKGPTSIVLPGVRIAADVTNNSLVIYASQENYRLIEQTLTQLDRPQLQVAIHATIAQITLNNDLQYGVEYYLQNNGSSIGFNTQASGTSTTTSSSTGAIVNPQSLAAILPGGNFLLSSQTNPSVVINALRTITDVKVLSSPSVVVLDNQEATLLVGDQVPVETGSANVLAATSTSSTTVVNSINYINTGVILRVLPRVNINGNVTLNVEQEVSGVVGSGTAPNLTPTVSQQQIKSAIAIASGQTVLLGGLITEQQSRTRNGIPVLEELPGVVGDLFSTNDRSTQRTELIVFIQPQIIRNSLDAAKVAEELRAKMRGSADNAFPPGPTLFRDPQFVR